MRRSRSVLPVAVGFLLVQLGVSSLARGGDWRPPSFHFSGFGPGFGKRGPEYDVVARPSPAQQSNPPFVSPTPPVNATPPGPPTPPGPSPAEVAAQRLRSEASSLHDQGVRNWRNKEWKSAADAFQAALDKCPENRTYQTDLKNALTAVAYEKHIQEVQERKGRALLEMGDCLGALSEALADVKSQVAASKMARIFQAGAEPEFGPDVVLTDASVVDLRRASTAVVGLEQLRSPYAKPPQPVFAGAANRLSDDQMLKLGNILLEYEINNGPTEQEVNELLGLPGIDHGGGTPAGGAPGTEKKQIHAALERFSGRLMDGCRSALRQTSQEIAEDPLTTKVQAMAALAGADHVNPAVRRLWEEHNSEAQQRLLARFRVVQDMAVRQLGAECTVIFKQAGPSPAQTAPGGR